MGTARNQRPAGENDLRDRLHGYVRGHRRPGRLEDSRAGADGRAGEHTDYRHLRLGGIPDRLHPGLVGLHGLARLVRNYCLYSGVIPQIALVLGPCAGPLAQVPVLSDFLIMNEKTGFLWLGGEIESEEAGRADFHMQKSGQVDLVAESDEEAMDLAKRLLEFMPQSCWEEPRPSSRTTTRTEGRRRFST